MCSCGKLDFNRTYNGFLCAKVNGLYAVPQKQSHQYRRRGQGHVSSCLVQYNETLRASYGEIFLPYNNKGQRKSVGPLLFTCSVKVNRRN